MEYIMTTCDKTCLNKGYTLTLSAKDTEYGGIKVGSHVYHIKDDISHQGTVVSIDTNLPDITTCRVLWDDDNTHTPDVQWTNKLVVVVKELDDLIVTLQDKSSVKEIRIETVLNKRNI